MVETFNFDTRWRGQHGIARYAHEVSKRLTGKIPLMSDRISPASLLDPFFIARTMAGGGGRGLFVSPGYNVGLPGKYRQIVTVHDLIHLVVPEERSPLKSAYYAGLVGPVIRSSPVVLTVSEFSKRAIASHFRLDPDRIAVVGNGSSMQLLAHPVTGGPMSPFILFVGNAKPHKNFELLLKAARYLDPGLRIVVVGLSPAQVEEQCRRHNEDSRRFDVRNGLTDEELQDLYTRASCVSIPSTYEGFGLVAVEAMSRATPSVYCCDAVREVVGDTGEFSPGARDAREYASALERAISVKSERFEQLTRRASRFSWENVAERVAARIRSA